MVARIKTTILSTCSDKPSKKIAKSFNYMAEKIFLDEKNDSGNESDVEAWRLVKYCYMCS